MPLNHHLNTKIQENRGKKITLRLPHPSLSYEEHIILNPMLPIIMTMLPKPGDHTRKEPLAIAGDVISWWRGMTCHSNTYLGLLGLSTCKGGGVANSRSCCVEVFRYSFSPRSHLTSRLLIQAVQGSHSLMPFSCIGVCSSAVQGLFRWSEADSVGGSPAGHKGDVFLRNRESQSFRKVIPEAIISYLFSHHLPFVESMHRHPVSSPLIWALIPRYTVTPSVYHHYIL